MRRLTVGLVGEGAPAALRRIDRPSVEHGVLIVEEPDASSHAACQLIVGVGTSDDQTARAAADIWLDDVDEVAELWRTRVVPFASNVASGTRAPRRQRAVLFDPDPTWPAQAKRLITRLRFAIEHGVLRMDHIGSTSVPALPAKNLIDIQIVVPDLAAAAAVADAARAAGFVRVGGPLSCLDRHGIAHLEEVVVDADPGRPVNVNIRPVTAPIWRETLLFRDWLRASPDARAEYLAVKRRLADRPGHDVDDYGRDKVPWISAGSAKAETWAAEHNWTLVATPTDANLRGTGTRTPGSREEQSRTVLNLEMPAAENVGAVHAFLEAHLGPGLELVSDLPQGAWSRAFAFRHRGRDYVVRFNPQRSAFAADVVAQRFATTDLPVPALLEVGETDGGWFAISERVAGDFLEELTPEQMHAALPSVLNTLEALRSADTTGSTGLGPWDASGHGTYATWPDYLFDLDREAPAALRPHWRDVLAESALGQAAFDVAMVELRRLAPACADRRDVVHSDLLNRNVFVADDRVSGVIDWQCAMFGDHLYDVAWFMFWAPWHAGLASIDWRARALDRLASAGADLTDAATRLRCYEAHIGLRHLVYHTGRDHADVDATARRTLELLAEPA